MLYLACFQVRLDYISTTSLILIISFRKILVSLITKFLLNRKSKKKKIEGHISPSNRYIRLNIWSNRNPTNITVYLLCVCHFLHKKKITQPDIFKTAPKLVCNCSNLNSVKLPDCSQFPAGLSSSVVNSSRKLQIKSYQAAHSTGTSSSS